MSALAGLLVLAAAGSLELSAQSEVRLRDGTGLTAPSFEVEVAPAALLRGRTRGFEVSLGYAPRFTLRQDDLRASFGVLQTGGFDATWRGLRTGFWLHGGGTYGTETFASLAPTTVTSTTSPAQPIDRLPATAALAYLSARTAATVTYVATTRLGLRFTVEGTASGGADDAARDAVPLGYGPGLSLGADYSLTRVDHLVSALDVSYTMFSSEREAGVASLTETWRHALSRRTEWTLGAGLGGALSRADATQPFTQQLYPLAEAGLTHRAPAEHVEGRLTVSLAPIVDRLTGKVDERVQGSLDVTWQASRRLALHGRAGAAQSVLGPEADAITLVLGEASISSPLSEHLRLELGTRGALQEPEGASQWILFVGATAVAQALRF